MSSKPKFSVLVIDDEESNIQSFKLMMRNVWNVDGVTDPETLKADYAACLAYDLIFLDLLFDTSTDTSDDTILKRADGGQLLGLHFLDWIQENHPGQAIAIYSGYLLDPIVKRIRSAYPHILMLPKPVDFTTPSFPNNMEYYASKFIHFKYDDLGKKTSSHAAEIHDVPDGKEEDK